MFFWISGGTYVTLVGPYGGIETCKLGYSWTTLFFWWFVPFGKGDWLFGMAYLLLTYLTRGLAQLFIPFFYNRYHIMRRLSQGWRPATAEDAEALRARWFRPPEPYSEAYDPKRGGDRRGGFARGAEEAVEELSEDPYGTATDWEKEREEAIDAEYRDQ